MLLDLKVPYAIVGRDCAVLWANDEFCRITGMFPNHSYEIGEFFPNVTKQVLEDCSDEEELFYDTKGMQFRLLLKMFRLRSRRRETKTEKVK